MKLLKLLFVMFAGMVQRSIILFNTNMDYLYPEFWAQSFESLNMGEYNLQNHVSRGFEKDVAKFGTKVNVPLSEDFGDADDWTPGDTISGAAISQEEAEVTLNKSKKKTIGLTAKELSLSPYDLIENYGVGMAKSILVSVNKSLYIEALKSKYFVDACAGISEDLIVTAGTRLSKNEVSKIGRRCIAGPDVMGALSKIDAFQSVSTSGDNDVMKDGLVTRRLGFDFYENNAISKYTPADVTGACASASLNATSLTVTGFNDDAAPVREGDKLTIADDSEVYTVTSVTATDGDTTAVGIYPALGTAISTSKVVTITPVQSALCFVPSAMALAARSYGELPAGVGVSSKVTDYQGLPVRWSVWHDGKLGLAVQVDILYGVKLVHDSRMVRIMEDL